MFWWNKMSFPSHITRSFLFTEYKGSETMGKPARKKVTTRGESLSDDGVKVGSPDAAILDYLNKQYRPYSTNDIIQNLHGEYSKAVVQKTLESLATRGLILSKLFGKSLITSAVKMEVDENEANVEYGYLITEVNEKLADRESEISLLQEQLKEVKKYPDDLILDEDIATLEAQVKTLEKRIARTATTKTLSPESVENIKNVTLMISKELNRRKKIYKELMKYLSEFIDTKALSNALGLDETLPLK